MSNGTLLWSSGLVFFMLTSIFDESRRFIASVVVLNGILCHGSCFLMPGTSTAGMIRLWDIGWNVALICYVNTHTDAQPLVCALSCVAAFAYLLNQRLRIIHMHVMCVQLPLWVALVL